MDNVFERVNRWIGETEHSLVNMLTAIAPWLAPMVPMSLTVDHMIHKLAFDTWVAYPTGFAIEVLGLATISTSLTFWKHNHQYVKEFERGGKIVVQDKQRVPLELAIAAFVWYFVVVMAIVVVLSLPWRADVQVYVDVVVKGLLTTLSIPAAVVLAIRAQYAEVRREIIENRSGRRSAERSSGRSDKHKDEQRSSVQMNSKPTVSIDEMNEIRRGKRGEKLNDLVEFYRRNPGASYAKAGRYIGRSKGWVGGEIQGLIDAGRLHRNSHGVQAADNGS